MITQHTTSNKYIGEMKAVCGFYNPRRESESKTTDRQGFYPFNPGNRSPTSSARVKNGDQRAG